jgi:AcrR family transcriptional regulator
MTATLPLRDRKKAKLRAALADASLKLFLKKGYAGTTLEDICAECDVTVPTLLRYFGSKEDLMFARQENILEKFTKGLPHATAKKETVNYWLQYLHASTLRVIADREIFLMYRIIEGVPALLAKFYTIVRQYEELLERALCEELGLEAGEDLYSALLAHLLVYGPVQDALRAIAQGDADSMARRSDSVARYILDNFRRPSNKKNAKTARNRQKNARRGVSL